MKQIFPKEILENTAEVHQFRHGTRSKVVYLVLLLALAGAFISLPFISVRVHTTARGIIKPDKERIALQVINSGKVVFSNFTNNQRVGKGDTLLIIDNNGIDDQLDLSASQTEELQLFMADLAFLLVQSPKEIDHLKSSKYQRDFLQYAQKLKELDTRHKKMKKDFERHQYLYDKGVISRSEYENTKLDYDVSLSDVHQFKKQQQNSWQADLTQYENQRKELASNKERLIKSRAQFLVTAPISGILLNVRPQELGNLINAGTVLGEISPDTDLLVECYVSPSDIGLLQGNDKVSFQVDAYNYNQWGLATGRVMEIAKDIELLDDRPVFKIRCTIDQKHLSLKNGFKGNLKKGMTLSAHFELAERTLYDLLYDKMDDWLNPNRKEMVKL